MSHNILPLTQNLEEEGATTIFVLTDLDETLCITKTKERIKPLPNHIVVISVKTIEAWFLADSESMRSVLNDSTFFIENPELIANPFEEIKSVRLEKTRRITNSKVILANLLIKHHSFSIQNAAKHPNCNSAKYFLETIRKISINS